MANDEARSSSEHFDSERQARRTIPARWILAAAALLVVGGGAALAYWLAAPGRWPRGSIEGQLVVYVRGAQRAAEALPVEEQGALPARAGGIMALDVHVNQPVFSYLVWLDGQGRVVPLYPWNFDRPDVTDIEQPPPKRIPTNILMSPPPGSGWDFGEQGGMETVLFLIRKTPLPEGTSVGKLIGDLPSPVPVREPAELAVFEVKDKAKSVTTVVSQARGDQAAAKAADEPLKAMLLRLSPHFDLVRAVRFAHVGAEPPAQE